MQPTVIEATLEGVSQYSAALEAALAALPNISDALRTMIVLAVHELCVNIVEHGYGGLPGEIHTALSVTPSALAITVRDGAPSDFQLPDRIPAPDPSALPEGGMGLYLLHTAFDRVTHERLPDGNRWHMSKLLEQPE